MTLALYAYALLGLVMVRPLAGHFAYRIARRYPSQNGKPDGADWSSGWFIGGLVAALWAGLLPLYVFYTVGDRLTRRIRIGAERHYLREREKEVALQRDREFQDEWDARIE